MYFYWDYHINGFLFENFNIDTLTKCLVVIFIVFLLAFINESIKILQKVLNKKFMVNLKVEGDARREDGTSEASPLVQHLRIPLNEAEIKRARLKGHIIQSILYTLNLFIAYILMNIAMVYYSGHFLAILIGCGFGYYFLNVISPDFDKSVSVNPYQSITVNDSSRSATFPRTSNSNVNYDAI